MDRNIKEPKMHNCGACDTWQTGRKYLTVSNVHTETGGDPGKWFLPAHCERGANGIGTI